MDKEPSLKRIYSKHLSSTVYNSAVLSVCLKLEGAIIKNIAIS